MYQVQAGSSITRTTYWYGMIHFIHGRIIVFDSIRKIRLLIFCRPDFRVWFKSIRLYGTKLTSAIPTQDCDCCDCDSCVRSVLSRVVHNTWYDRCTKCVLSLHIMRWSSLCRVYSSRSIVPLLHIILAAYELCPRNS